MDQTRIIIPSQQEIELVEAVVHAINMGIGMGQVSTVLRKTKTGYAHYCPACDEMHHIWVGNESGPNWSFSGDVNKPTFHPSVLLSHPDHTDDDGTKHARETLCHYFLVYGEIKFCGDCPHELKGQTVPLPVIPERFSDENYGWSE